MKTNSENSLDFREQVKHGTSEFQLQLYRDVEYYENGQIFYNHWHEEAEIIYILAGEMELVVNGVSIFAKKNTTILIPPNLLHGAYQYQDRKCRFSSIVFHTDFISSKMNDCIQEKQLNPFFDDTFLTSYVLSSFDRSSEIVEKLLRSFEDCYIEEHPYRELLLKGYLFQILFYLLQREEKYSVKSTSDYVNEERKKKILNFIDENYSAPLTLLDLSESISLSKEQFCRFFKHSFRSTPINYLNQYRIDRAMILLRETSLSIIDIAFSVGFESSNYFSIAFKKATNMTPTQFRKMTRS